MKRIILFLFLCLSATSTVSAAEVTLDDFFDKNPEFKKNTALRMAIKSQAESIAMMDGDTPTSGRDILKSIGGVKDRLNEKGYDYAVIAVREIKESCEVGMQSMHSLSLKECGLINNYEEDN